MSRVLLAILKIPQIEFRVNSVMVIHLSLVTWIFLSGLRACKLSGLEWQPF
jgi:hypothetical protein